MHYLDKIPPWTAGWSVLTRPPNISGAPVISETSFTLRPASRKDFAVPPLATNVNPRSLKFFPSVIKPVLFDTLNKAVIKNQTN